MQRLSVAYNFGCRALCNLPWRASISNHQVQCNIPTSCLNYWSLGGQLERLNKAKEESSLRAVTLELFNSSCCCTVICERNVP